VGRRHYLHHDYAEEKKRAWHLLGDRLSAVLDLRAHAKRVDVVFSSVRGDRDAAPLIGMLHAALPGI